MRKLQVIFHPSHRKGETSSGGTILKVAQELGIGIESVCGGQKACGKCKIKLEKGFFERYGFTSHPEHLSPFTKKEEKFISEAEKEDGYRLGCAAQIIGDVLIFVPEVSLTGIQMIRKGSMEREIDIKPAVSLCYLELAPPTHHYPLGDLDRIKNTLFEKYDFASLDIYYYTLLKIPDTLRKGNWNVTVAIWMRKQIIDIKPGRVEEAYGLAIDIGTTTVAGYLCNLYTGKIIASESIMNPQIIFGEDVMSRITYTMTHSEDGLEKMHNSIIKGLNQLIRQITEKAGLTFEDILELTIVGNTAMHHCLLKITPQYLGVSPFPPAIQQSLNMKARDLGLAVHPSANVYILPIEGGFVGADNVGVIIAEKPYNEEMKVLMIDIGTNGELVMGSHEKLISCSCATGPAFEGAHIKFGMRAAFGAIERVKIYPKTYDVKFEVIGKEDCNSESSCPKAKGICGSGIIDAIAELYRTGIIDKRGRFRDYIQTPRLKRVNGELEFVIAWENETSIGREITITQQDVRNVQLAKGALYAGAKLMMKKLGIEKLDKVVLAGAFGSFINVENAMILGMFPDCDLAKVYAVGNAAGDGARMALVNINKRAEAEQIGRQVKYIELSIEDDFQDEFVNAMLIPHARDPFPHLKSIVSDEILD